MKVAVLTLAYNEEDVIGATLRNWQGKCFKHLVLLSSKPWHGQELPPDRTRQICEKLGAEVISMPWPSETAQRNWGLGYLRDFDYVIIVDADELYTAADQTKLLDSLGTKGENEFVNHMDAYKALHLVTYFKTPNYRLDPPDHHRPSIAVNPKKVVFAEHRLTSSDFEVPLDIQVHHVTYLRPDIRLYHKLRQFEHHDAVKSLWFEDVWKKWKPEMEDVRAYGFERSRAVLNPMPDELRDLLFTAQSEDLTP